jgi:hypothetical protein
VIGEDCSQMVDRFEVDVTGTRRWSSSWLASFSYTGIEGGLTFLSHFFFSLTEYCATTARSL